MKINGSSLWSPSDEIKKNSKLESFCKYLDKKKILKYNQNFKYLWKWSVDNPEAFWSEVWDFTKIKGFKGKKIIKKTFKTPIRNLSNISPKPTENYSKIDPGTQFSDFLRISISTATYYT